MLDHRPPDYHKTLAAHYEEVSSDPQTIKLGSTTIHHCHTVVVCTRLSSTEQFAHMPTGHIHTASTPPSQPSLITIWRFPYDQRAKKTMASFRAGGLYTGLLWSGLENSDKGKSSSRQSFELRTWLFALPGTRKK